MLAIVSGALVLYAFLFPAAGAIVRRASGRCVESSSAARFSPRAAAGNFFDDALLESWSR